MLEEKNMKKVNSQEIVKMKKATIYGNIIKIKFLKKPF